MRSRNLKIWLASAVVIFAVLLILINLNFLLERIISLRLDVTSDRLYTLTEGTRNILKTLPNPVTIRFYRTYKDNRMPPALKIYADKVSSMLKEYSNAGKGKIILEEYDPVPDSDAETSAIIDEIEPKILPSGEKCYFGISFSCLDRNSSIPYLSPGNEATLEYDITRSIYDTAISHKIVIGVLSSLPVMGNSEDIIPAQAMTGSKKLPWIFIQELQKLFEVRSLNFNVQEIPPDIAVLIVVHPAGISKAAEYAMDQYLLGGGRLLVFVDPYCIAASNSPEMSLFSSPPPPNASELPSLFKAWGIRFSPPNQVVIDPDNAYHVMNDPNSKEHPAVLNYQDDLFNKKDIVMFGLNKLNMVFSGAFSGGGAEGLQKTSLLQTSMNSELYNNFSFYVSPEEILHSFKPMLKQYDLIIRLTGDFKTSFPEGNPSGNQPDRAKSLKASVKESSVILSGDADMLFNPFCVARQTIYGKSVVAPINNNIDFVLNAVDQLSGDVNILKIRGRGALERNFDKFEVLYNAARKKYQSKISELNSKLKETEGFISSIQGGASGSGTNSGLSSEQLKAIQKYRLQENETKRELKQVRRELRADVDSLKMKIEIMNLALIPVLLCAIGIFFGIKRKMRR